MIWNKTEELTKSSFFRHHSTKFDKIKIYNIVEGEKMSITIVENIILNIILVVFPLLVYLVLVIYNDNTSKKNNSNLMTITLITSLYLCIIFGSL